jgi:hypothetical protein
MNELISNRHPVLSLSYILLVVATGFLFLGPALGLLFASPFYDGNLFADFTAIRGGQSNPQLFTALMVVQATAGLLGLVVFPIVYLNVIEHKSITGLFRNETNWALLLSLLMGTGICFTVAISPVIEWNMGIDFPEWMGRFEDWARQQENELMKVTRFLTTFSSPADFMLGLLVIAVIPGVGEELVFRGLIQNELFRGTKNIHVAIWVSAVLFSAMHLQFFGFVPRMLLGALFGYLYYWSGNLLVPMLAHFFHNGFTLLLLYANQQGLTSFNPESNEAAPMPFVLGCALAAVGLLYYFRKLYRIKNQAS